MLDPRVWRPAILSWIAARVVVAAAWVLVQILDDNGALAEVSPSDDGLLAWDGRWYERIADDGYSEGGEEIRFSPLFPWLGRGFGYLVGDAGTALVLVSNVAALAAGVLLAQLVLERTGSIRHASRATWAMALWPASFVLVFAYTESLLLALALVFVLALRRDRIRVAAAAGFAAGLVRPTGAALAILAVAGAVEMITGSTRPRPWAKLAPVIAPVAGLATFLVLSARWHGNFWGPIDEQSPLRGDLVDPVTRVIRGFTDIAGDETLGDGLHLPFVLGAIGLLVVVFRRLGPAEGFYSLALVLVAMSADNWNSFERYLIGAYPVFIALALVTRRSEPDRLWTVVTSTGLFALCSLAWIGEYVP